LTSYLKKGKIIKKWKKEIPVYFSHMNNKKIKSSITDIIANTVGRLSALRGLSKVNWNEIDGVKFSKRDPKLKMKERAYKKFKKKQKKMGFKGY